jgi:hypothetical protein
LADELCDKSEGRVGSVSDDIGFVNLLNPSSCILALGLTQPLREMSARNLPVGV